MIFPLVRSSWSLVATLVLLLANLLAVRLFLPRVYASPVLRRGWLALAMSALAAHGAWVVFRTGSVAGRAGGTFVSAAPVFLALVLVSIPSAGILSWLARRSRPAVVPEAEPQPEPKGPEDVAPALARPRITRRAALSAVAALPPASALGAGAIGFSTGFASPSVRTKVLSVPKLPKALEGLRIVQVSDVHLGVYRTTADLEAALERASLERPDLVVVTGDFVERSWLWDEALSVLTNARPRLGVYGCLGNHEHFQSTRDVRRAYERANVPLLVDDGVTLDVDGASLALLGIDDPRAMRGDIETPMRASIERALRKAQGDFRVLLSHRPEGIVPASSLDVGLVLAGHTHGGQIGFAGKSAFEPLAPDGYLWGPYLVENTRLYTTSGFGHWYPFRLGCGAELPVLELRRG
jgi:predicted MPP superfamily phosphohydrolase